MVACHGDATKVAFVALYQDMAHSQREGKCPPRQGILARGAPQGRAVPAGRAGGRTDGRTRGRADGQRTDGRTDKQRTDTTRGTTHHTQQWPVRPITVLLSAPPESWQCPPSHRGRWQATPSPSPFQLWTRCTLGPGAVHVPHHMASPSPQRVKGLTPEFPNRRGYERTTTNEVICANAKLIWP